VLDAPITNALTIVTIGHSRHSLELFVALLEAAQLTAVADVRSAPISRFSPHFNKGALVRRWRSGTSITFFSGRNSEEGQSPPHRGNVRRS